MKATKAHKAIAWFLVFAALVILVMAFFGYTVGSDMAARDRAREAAGGA